MARDEDGFTLAELLVALSVVAVVATAFLGTLLGAVTAARGQEDRTRGNQIAQAELEAVVAAPWASIGLYSSDSGYRATFGGELTVTLTASPRSASVPLPLDQMSAGAISYSVRIDVTWRDDPADGVGVADANGVPNDMKHVVVEVSWVRAGETRTVKLEDLRSPTATEVTPSAAATAALNVGAPATHQLASSGNLASALTVTATATRSMTSAVLTFRTRAGLQSVLMTNSGGGTSFSATLSTAVGPFDTGPTSFGVTASNASGSASGSAAVQLSMGATVVVRAAPNQLLTASNTLSSPIGITVTGSSPITAATVSYATSSNGTIQRSLTGSGSTWSTTVPIDGVAFVPGIETFTVLVTFSDGTTGTGKGSVTLDSAAALPEVLGVFVIDPWSTTAPRQSFCVKNNDYKLFKQTSVDATVANVVPTDTVVLTVPGITDQTFPMTYLRTNANGSRVFRLNVPAGQQFPPASAIALKVYASAMVSGTQYRDDLITDPAPAIKAVGNSNSCG